MFESRLGTNTPSFAFVRHFWDAGQLGRFWGHVLKFRQRKKKRRKKKFWGIRSLCYILMSAIPKMSGRGRGGRI